MTRDIKDMAVGSGRQLKDDNTVVNVAEEIEEISDTLKEGLDVTTDNGTDATGVVPPVGGTGMLGWLSGIYSKISGILGVEVADGDDITLGAKADAAATAGDVTPFSVVAILKGIWVKLAGTLTVRLSGVITPTYTTVTAANTTTQALAANVNRKYALLLNDSDEVIYIKSDAAAVLNQGIRLNANGGNYEMSNSIGNLTLGPVNCISTSGGKSLLVEEGV